jgi:hypothetical protein
VVLLSAISAEVHRVELRAFGLTAWSEALGVQGDVSPPYRFKRGQHLSGAADELMELERKRCAALTFLDRAAVEASRRFGCRLHVLEEIANGDAKVVA